MSEYTQVLPKFGAKMHENLIQIPVMEMDKTHGATVDFPALDSPHQVFKVIRKAVPRFPVDLRLIKFGGYQSNNDRKSHGKHVLRLRQIEICRKRNPELTLEARFRDRLGDRVDRMIESSILYSAKFPVHRADYLNYEFAR